MADPYVPGPPRPLMPSAFPGLQREGVMESPPTPASPPDVIDTSFPVLRELLRLPVFLNLFRFLPPSEYHPVIRRGKSSLFTPGLSKTGRKRGARKTDGERQEEEEVEEGGGERLSCGALWSLSLSLFLCPTFTAQHCRKWENPPDIPLSSQTFLCFSHTHTRPPSPPRCAPPAQ